MNLAFDPAKSPHYKVVCVCKLESDQYQIELYSSERGPWRKCGQPFATAAHIDFTKGVYWNGAIHWFSNGHGDSLYFNIENETAQVFSTPAIHDHWNLGTSFYFGESCDHLHFIETFGAQLQLDVYEMKRDYSEWFVKYKFDISCVVASFPEMVRDRYNPADWDYYAFSIFSVVRGEKEEDSFLVVHIPGRVVRYNLLYGTFETMHEFADAEIQVSEKSLRYWGTNGFQYIESLSCV